MRDRFPILLECLVLAAAAISVVAPTLGSTEVPGTGVDLHGTLWFHWWLPHALVEGLDPRTTDLFFHPLGKDLFTHTGMNLVDAALSAPFQWVFGHPGYLGPFTAAVLVANGLAFRPLVADWELGPRLVGCLAFALSPYALGEIASGRTAQACLFTVPLAIHLALRCSRPGWRSPVLLGVATAATGWIYWFYGYFLALGLAWVLVHQAVVSRDRAGLARRWLVAVVVGTAGVAPAVVPMLVAAAAGAVPLLHGGAAAPTPPVVGSVLSPAIAAATLIWLFVGRQRSLWAPMALLMVAVVAGRFPGRVLNPMYALMDNVPFWERLAFPYRALGVAALPLAWILADLARRWGRVLGSVVVGAVVAVGAAPFVPAPTQDVSVPELLLALEPGGFIGLPIESAGALVAWQPLLQEPLFGGMGATAEALWPAGFAERRATGFVKALELAASARAPQAYEDDDVLALRAEGFRYVVYQAPADGGPRARAARKRLDSLLGPALGEQGPLVVWDMARLSGGVR